MPDFTFTGPGGREITLTGPEGATRDDAIRILEQHHPEVWQEPPAPAYGALEAAGEGFLKGVSANWRDEIYGASRASGLPEWLGGFRVPVGVGRLVYENLAQPQSITSLVTGTDERPAHRDYARARDEIRRREDEMARQHPGWFGAGDIAGAIAGTAAVPEAGVTREAVARFGPAAGRIAGGAASGAGYGGLAGAGQARDAKDVAGDAATGTLAGGVIGAAAPVVARAAGAALAPVVSNVRARLDPQGYGWRQVARAAHESGQEPHAITGRLLDAAADHQGMYTPADAMGLAGRRMLSAVTRAPGEGREAAAEFLEARQAGQGRRVANQLAEGFRSPRTARETEEALTEARDRRADREYAAARRTATPVDVTPVIAAIDATLTPGVNQIARPPSGIVNDSIEAALAGVRRRLTDNRSNLTDFAALQRVRADLADMVQSVRNSGHGNRARILRGVLAALDRQMEAASPGFRQANRAFAQASDDIRQIGEGRAAATRGRPEDTIPAFRALAPPGQAAWRAGYVDPLIEQVRGAAAGVNKARPFTADAFRDEARAMAPGAARMERQLARENEMFATRNHALGGSRTADNLADAEAMGVDVSMIGHVLSGNYGAALRAAAATVSRGVTGNTPQVRRAVADILLARGISPLEFESRLTDTIRRIVAVQEQARGLVQRGGNAVAAAAPDVLQPGHDNALAPRPSP